MAGSNGQVRFIRINGRVVPIRQKPGQSRRESEMGAVANDILRHEKQMTKKSSGNKAKAVGFGAVAGAGGGVGYSLFQRYSRNRNMQKIEKTFAANDKFFTKNLNSARKVGIKPFEDYSKYASSVQGGLASKFYQQMIKRPKTGRNVVLGALAGSAIGLAAYGFNRMSKGRK